MSSPGADHKATVLSIGLGLPNWSKGNDSRKYSVCVELTLSDGWIDKAGTPLTVAITGNDVKKTALSATRLAFETAVTRAPAKPPEPKPANSLVLRNTKWLSRPSSGWSP